MSREYKEKGRAIGPTFKEKKENLLDSDRLRAELATFRIEWDVALALRAGLGGGWRRRIELLQEILGRENKEEVDDARHQDEIDDGRKEIAITDFASVYMGDEEAKVGLADKRAEKRVNNLFHKRVHNGGKRRTDDDCNCEVHHIAAQDEISKTFQHGEAPWI